MEIKNAIHEYALRLGDNALILGQRLGEWCGYGPILEQDIALTNIALDQIGQARNFYQYAAKLAADGKTEDDYAYKRDVRQFKNLLMLELPNGHWGDTLTRQFLFDTFNYFQFDKLRKSKDEQIAAIAQKALKEISYHAQWSAEWIIRLGDGTEESHEKIQKSIDEIWMWTGEMFEMDELHVHLLEVGIGVNYAEIEEQWHEKVAEILEIATLIKPQNSWMQSGGKKGVHTEHLGFVLAEMQFLPRAYPDAKW